MYNMMNDTRDRSVVPKGTAVLEPPIGSEVSQDDHIEANGKPDVAVATLAS
jgi:hypothetical protein